MTWVWKPVYPGHGKESAVAEMPRGEEGRDRAKLRNEAKKLFVINKRFPQKPKTGRKATAFPGVARMATVEKVSECGTVAEHEDIMIQVGPRRAPLPR